MKKIIFLIAIGFAAFSGKAQVNPYPLVSIDSIQFVSAQNLSQNNTIPAYNHPVYGDTVQIEGVVSWDPQFYGLSRNRKATFLQSAVSGPWKGIEVMIDTSIFGLGSNNPTLKDLNNITKFYDNFQPGLTVRCTGILTNFPATNSQTGNSQLKLLQFESLITNTTTQNITPAVLTIDQFMKNNGAGGQTWLPATGEAYEGVYVEFKNVKVTDRSQGTGANAARWFWTIVDDFGNKIRIRDYSGYYRNDDNEATYIPNTYSPPAANTYLSYVRGVIVENIAGSGAIDYMLAPLMPSDVGPANAFVPPTISYQYRSPMVPNASQDVTIYARITDDSAVSDAVLHYAVGYNATNFSAVSMTPVGNIYSGLIPKQADGSFVKFWIEATDNFGHKSYFPDTLGSNMDYMVVDGGLTKISQIQTTPNADGSSLWNGDTTVMDIRGVVVSSALTSDLGIIAIQQGNAPFSGIFLRQNTGDGLNALKRGDSIRITKALVREIGGATYLDSLRGNWSLISSGHALPAFVSGNIDSIALKKYNYTEPYEAMLMKFDTLYVVNLNADAPSQFGEWVMYYQTGTGMPGVRVRGQSPDIGSTFNIDSLGMNQKMNFVQGVFTFSFSNWKLMPRNKQDLDLSNLPDKIAPVITLKGNWTDSLELGKSYTDPGATALDDREGDISSRIIRTGSIDSSKVGVYQLCYNVADNAGNNAQQVCRNVIVYTKNGISHSGIQMDIMVYPNPANGYLTVESKTFGNATLELLDLTGKLVFQATVTNRAKVDLSQLAKGTYMLRLISGSAMGQKIIVLQ